MTLDNDTVLPTEPLEVRVVNPLVKDDESLLSPVVINVVSLVAAAGALKKLLANFGIEVTRWQAYRMCAQIAMVVAVVHPINKARPSARYQARLKASAEEFAKKYVASRSAAKKF